MVEDAAKGSLPPPPQSVGAAAKMNQVAIKCSNASPLLLLSSI
jgi:hypothetical protein